MQIAVPRTLFPAPSVHRAIIAGSRTFLRELREGFSWLRRSVGLLELTISAGFFNFFNTIFGTFVVFYATEALHGSALVFAGLVGLELLGSAAGALLVGRTNGVRFAGKAWVVGYGALQGGMLVVLALFPIASLALVLVFSMGLAGSYAGTAWLSGVQLLVPTELQGRYFGIDSLGSWAIIPVGQLAGGILIASLGISETCLIAGIRLDRRGSTFLDSSSVMAMGVPTYWP